MQYGADGRQKNLNSPDGFFGFHSALHLWTARRVVRTVVYIVVEQMFFHLLLRKVMYEILCKHIADYFETTDAADKFICLWGVEAVAAERIVTKIGKQMKRQILDSHVKCDTQKSVSSPTHTDSAPTSSPSYKDGDVKAYIRGPEHHSRSRRLHRRYRKDHERRQHQIDRPNDMSDALTPTRLKTVTKPKVAPAKGRTALGATSWEQLPRRRSRPPQLSHCR